MIIITGAAGFIGSCVVEYFNSKGHEELILVDDFSRGDKAQNFQHKKYSSKIERSAFLPWFEKNHTEIKAIIHIGAKTDTTLFDKAVFDELNVNYTKAIWQICTINQIPLIYASSAATYGLGECGYNDDHGVIPKLKPLNPYGDSKNTFDLFAIQQKQSPKNWYGLKFFNVYGPNEYHKARMASVIFHAFHQIQQSGKVKLFKSHKPEYKDGGQLRDFVYVKDLVKVIYYLYQHHPQNGIYNLGSGKARTFYDLADNTFKALNKNTTIEFIDTPADIRDKYQYFTEANMSKLIQSGYNEPFYSLEEGISDYVQNYLLNQRHY